MRAIKYLFMPWFCNGTSHNSWMKFRFYNLAWTNIWVICHINHIWHLLLLYDMKGNKKTPGVRALGLSRTLQELLPRQTKLVWWNLTGDVEYWRQLLIELEVTAYCFITSPCQRLCATLSEHVCQQPIYHSYLLELEHSSHLEFTWKISIFQGRLFGFVIEIKDITFLFLFPPSPGLHKIW